MSLALRPSWSVEIAQPSRAVIERLAAPLSASGLTLKPSRIPGGGDAGLRDTDFFLLSAPAAEQRVWSPWLSIDVAPRGDGTHVHARFSPHPSVWTGFAFGYLTLGVVFLVALVIASSGTLVPGAGQGWALWLAGGVALAIAGMWGAAQLGQRLGAAQMEALRGALDRALAACEAPAAAASLSTGSAPRA